MIRTFISSFNVSFAENVNTFIYFLKRIPLIGKKVPDSLYKETKAKIIIGIISEILSIIWSILKKGIYLALMIVLPAYFMSKGTGVFFTKFLHMFFFLNIIYGSIINSVVFDYTDRSAFNMITLMRADAREYYLSAMIYKYITNCIYFIIPMIAAGQIVGFSPTKALTMLVLLTSFRFVGECFNIFIYIKTGKVLSKENVFTLVFIVTILMIAYVLPLLNFYINLEPILFNGFVVLGVLVLGAVSLFYLWNYKRYIIIAKEFLTKENLFDIKAFESDMTFGDVKLKEDKISKEELSFKLYEEKQGYEYLNAIFFRRHRKMLVNPIKMRVIIIAISFLAFSAFIIFMPDLKEKVFGVILKSTPLLLFCMYILSTGEKICKAMFYNCDLSLLRYGYYREPKAILLNFTIRLKFTVLLNIIPAVALCASIAGVLIIAGFGAKLISVVPLFLCILCLACFFSIHSLFMYYAIQPYTAQLTVKSPLYKFMNFIVYMVSYACLRIRTSSYVFTVVVIAVTIIYMAVALILTYKVAPKTFKLK